MFSCLYLVPSMYTGKHGLRLINRSEFISYSNIQLSCLRLVWRQDGIIGILESSSYPAFAYWYHWIKFISCFCILVSLNQVHILLLLEPWNWIVGLFGHHLQKRTSIQEFTDSPLESLSSNLLRLICFIVSIVVGFDTAAVDITSQLSLIFFFFFFNNNKNRFFFKLLVDKSHQMLIFKQQQKSIFKTKRTSILMKERASWTFVRESKTCKLKMQHFGNLLYMYRG